MSCWMSSSRLHTTLTGSFDLLGDQRGLHDEVELEPAPEAAAQQVIVNAHLLRLQPERLRDGLLRDGGDLRADPDIAAVRRHLHGAVHRLHRRVREERRLVDGFDLGRGARQRGLHVALVLGDGAWRLRRLGQRGHDVSRGKRGVRPVVERCRAGLETLSSRPSSGRRSRQRHCRAWRPGARPALSSAAASSNEASVPPNTGDAATVATFMPGTFDVDAVDRRAVDLAGDIEPLGRRADDAEGARVLELDVGGSRQLRRRIGQLAISDAPTARPYPRRSPARS